MQGHVFLGKYTVTRQLDEGGMSKIFLAHQTNPSRDVVVKLLKEHLRVRHKALEHFRREIHITSRFQHPNAVAYYDSIPNDPMGPVLIMEYLRGTDLAMLMYRQGKFAADRVGRIVAQLCSVLDKAHHQGIVHRDVKPGNLMIVHPGTPQETVKLMDFGLAKMSSMLYISPEDVLGRDTPVASGTPEYMAPEQIRSNDIDGRADIYSVGIIMYEMLAGKRPFESTSSTELMRCHLKDDPPTFRDQGMGDEIPIAIEEVVRNCLAKSPDDRPRTAEELALQYEQALGKRINPIRSTPGLAMGASPGAASNGRPPPGSPPTKRLTIRNVLQHTVEAVMPESMAMIKLKGFIHDLGGEVIESVPGMIKVRLGSSTPEKKKSGLFGWLDKGGAKQGVMDPTSTAVLELRMERWDPSQPNNLTITLVIQPGKGLVTTEWQNRCKKIGMDLKAYLMGR
jgi:serine/threonine-protein kinase